MASRFTILTRDAIRTMSLGQRLREHGIIAERLVGADTRYIINVMVDRRRVHRVVGLASEGVSRQHAERLIEQLRAKAREGRLNLPKGRKVSMRLKDATKLYLERLEATDGKDLTNKRRHLNQHLVPALGSTAIDQLTEFALKQFRRNRLDQGANDATVNREFSTLLHLLNRAVEWDWLAADRKPRVRKPAEQRKKIRVLDEAQCARLRTAAANDQDERLALFVAFGLGAAMRHSEIMRVRYTDIDFSTRRVWIEHAKAGRRDQPITSDLADMLKKQKRIDGKGADWVFPAQRGYQGHRRDMHLPFKRIAEAAGLDSKLVTPHVMRHTAITRLVQAGVDVPTIQRISGHKTLAMVLHYTHLQGSHIDKAMEALSVNSPAPITQELHEADRTAPLGEALGSKEFV